MAATGVRYEQAIHERPCAKKSQPKGPQSCNCATRRIDRPSRRFARTQTPSDERDLAWVRRMPAPAAQILMKTEIIQTSSPGGVLSGDAGTAMKRLAHDPISAKEFEPSLQQRSADSFCLDSEVILGRLDEQLSYWPKSRSTVR